MSLMSRIILKFLSFFKAKEKRFSWVYNQSRNNNAIIVKDNKFNFVTYFSSVIQLKLLSRFIVEIVNKPDVEVYKVNIYDILKEFSIDKKNETRVKRLAKSMMKPLEVPEYIRKKTGFNLSVLFTDINIDNPDYIEFEVNKNLKPFIINLKKNFSFYFLKNISSLSSSFSYRIYEILKQYQDKTTKDGWLDISIVELRKRLGLDEEKYTLYSNFKNRVLRSSQKELSEKTDIAFTFEELKEDRKVIRLLFRIYENTERKEGVEKELKNKMFYTHDGIKSLLEFGLSEKKLLREWKAIKKEIKNGKFNGVNSIDDWFTIFVNQNQAILSGKKTKSNPQGWLMEGIIARGLDTSKIKIYKKTQERLTLQTNKTDLSNKLKTIESSIETLQQEGREKYFQKLSDRAKKKFIAIKYETGNKMEKQIIDNKNMLTSIDTATQTDFFILGYEFPEIMPKRIAKKIQLQEQEKQTLLSEIQKIESLIDSP